MRAEFIGWYCLPQRRLHLFHSVGVWNLQTHIYFPQTCEETLEQIAHTQSHSIVGNWKPIKSLLKPNCHSEKLPTHSHKNSYNVYDSAIYIQQEQQQVLHTTCATYNICYIQQGLHKQGLHTTDATYNRCYTQQGLHTTGAIHNKCYTQQELHTTRATYNRCYIQQELQSLCTVLKAFLCDLGEETGAPSEKYVCNGSHRTTNLPSQSLIHYTFKIHYYTF